MNPTLRVDLPPGELIAALNVWAVSAKPQDVDGLDADRLMATAGIVMEKLRRRVEGQATQITHFDREAERKALEEELAAWDRASDEDLDRLEAQLDAAKPAPLESPPPSVLAESHQGCSEALAQDQPPPTASLQELGPEDEARYRELKRKQRVRAMARYFSQIEPDADRIPDWVRNSVQLQMWKDEEREAARRGGHVAAEPPSESAETPAQ